jgi:hypothetical protein
MMRRWSIWAATGVVVGAAGLAWMFIWIVGGIVLLGFALSLARQTFRARLAVMDDADIGRSVLLLRPFAKDRKGGGGIRSNVFAQNLGLVGNLWHFSSGSLMRTFEEAFAPHVEQSLGPLFALGSPEEHLPPRGGRRIYASDDEWQEVAQRCSREARYVVVLAGSTPNLTCELQFLRGEVDPRKVFLLIEPFDRDLWVDVRQTLAEVNWSTPDTDPGPGSVIAFDEHWQAILVASGLRDGKEFAEILSRWISAGNTHAKENRPADMIEWQAPRHERPINWQDLSDVRNFGGRANQIATILLTAAAGLFFAMLVASALGMRGRGGALLVALLIFIPIVPVYFGAAAVGRYFASGGYPWALPTILAVVVASGYGLTVWNERAETEGAMWADLEQRHDSAIAALLVGDTPQFRREMTGLERRAEEGLRNDEADAEDIRRKLARWNAEVPAVVTQNWSQVAPTAIRNEAWHGELAILLRERGMVQQLNELAEMRSSLRERLLERGIRVDAESESLRGSTRDALVAGTIALLKSALPDREIYTEWPLPDIAEPDDALRAKVQITAVSLEFDDESWPQIPTQLMVRVSWSDEPPSPFSEPTVVSTAVRAAAHPLAELGITTDEQTLWMLEHAVTTSKRNTNWLLEDLDRAFAKELKR